MDLRLGLAGGALIDGQTSWDTVAENALATWNLYYTKVKFQLYTVSPGPIASGDHINQVFWQSSVYGQAFGSGVLAVTTRWSTGTTRTEGDTIFNVLLSWNSYRGSLRPAAGGGTLLDLQRVALHEFGHTLGLDHPDDAGQTITALMNSRISDLDALAADDINGVRILYPPVAPSAPTANAATSITASGFTANWSSASGATGFRIDVSLNNTFSSFVAGYQSLDVGNAITKSVTGLSGNTPYYYRVRAYNTGGTSGNSGTISVTTAAPNISATVQPNPTGRSFTVDGVNYISAQTFSWTSGSSHTIGTTSPQSGSTGIRYPWSSWSDGGAISHTVAPTSATTYTANFTTQYYLTTSAGVGGSVSPGSGWTNSGAVVPISAAASSGYNFNSWTGSGSGSYSGSSSSSSVTMNAPIAETANFAAVTQPTLGGNKQGGNMVFRWPTNAIGFTLQSSPNLGAAAVWGTVTPSPVVVGGLNVVTNPISGVRVFYRLRHP